MAGAAVLGLILERVAFRPLRGAHPLVPLISAIGASIFLQSLALLLFGPNNRPFPLSFDFTTMNLRGPAGVHPPGRHPRGRAGLHGPADGVCALHPLWQGHCRLRPGPGHGPSHGHQRQPYGVPDLLIGSALSGAGGIMMAIYYNATYPRMGFARPASRPSAPRSWAGWENIPGAILGGLLLGVAGEPGRGLYLVELQRRHRLYHPDPGAANQASGDLEGPGTLK